MKSRDVVEVVVFKDREELEDIAIRAMKILEELWRQVGGELC